MSLPFNRQTITATHPSRPAPWLPWIASAMFLVGLVAAIITLTVAAATDAEADDALRVRVIDTDSAAALADAEVTVNDEVFSTDGDGYIRITNSELPLTIEVSRDGYRAQEGTIDELSDTDGFVVALRQDNQQSQALTDVPAQDLAVAADQGTPESESQANVTDSTGAGTPDSASVDTMVATPDPALAQALTATPTPNAVSAFAGTITDESGQPLQGVIITDGQLTEVTGADGLFQFQLASSDAESIRVFAPGYAEMNIPTSDVSAGNNFQLEPQEIKAIYYNPNISSTQEDLDRLINLINTTEVNSMVIDIKEEIIFYDSQVQFFVDAGTVRPTLDLSGLLATLQENDIYTIARLVVFKDSIVADTYPDLAVTNNVTGEVWRDMNGVAWVNPMLHTLWDANIELAVEAANRGFDEIQYDYVRFPTDGDLSTMEFGIPYTEENRTLAMTKFLEQSRQALIPTGAKLSADVFGFTALVPDDLGIGQDLDMLAPHVDYLSPMVYPSHFPDGAMGLNGHPNNFPYETIEISMRSARDQLGSARQLRPWLQDFDYWEMIPYGVEEVRAQIQACEDVGTAGWMLWDPNNVYTDGALGPDDGNLAAYQPTDATLASTNQARTGSRRTRYT
jgi:predicted  nucleic acid-binding Zn-ribbon protein